MQRILMFFLFGVPGLVFTQAPILNSSVNPPLGSVYPFRVLQSVLDMGDGGENLIWDFSALSEGIEAQISISDPASDADAGDFPGCTHVVSGAGPKTYYRIQTNGWEVLGIGQAGVTVYCLNGLREFALPRTYNQQGNDFFTCNFNQFGVFFNRTGLVSSRYDGYGTLILPNGSVSGVVRMRILETSNDAATVAGLPISNQNQNLTYYYFKPGLPYPIMIYNVNSGTLNPVEVTTLRYAVLPDMGFDGDGSIEFHIALPSLPVRDGALSIVFSEPDDRGILLDILDISGRSCVYPVRTFSASLSLPVAHLSAGVYILRVERRGRIDFLRFSIHS
jgi:hypothetical protein